MTVTWSAVPIRVRHSRDRWSWGQYLALLALPLLGLQVSTLARWIAAGPHAVAAHSARTSDWYLARALEAVAIVLSLAVVVGLLRGMWRARRLLTFDVLWCLAGATIFWADVGPNVFLPEVVVSANWVNLNSPCGHIPWVPNPDCGRTPDPLLFMGLLETFLILGFARVTGWLAGHARGRLPALAGGRLFAFYMIAGMIVVLFEPFVVIPLHGWNYPGMPGSIAFGSGRYPIFEVFAFGLGFGLFGALYNCRDDRGRTLVERGLDRYRGGVRTLVTWLSLYACFQLIAWGVGDGLLWPAGFHQHRWEPTPRWVVNRVCNAPGINGTRYGPCPGSPGFRMPLQLPGRSP